MIGLLALTALQINVALADVSSDIDAGLSIEQVLSNAQGEGINLVEAVAQIAAKDPSMAAAAVVAAISIDPSQASAIVAAATQAAPNQANAISQAAEVAAAQAQIASSGDDIEGEATAAGRNPNAATPAIPNGPGIPATPAIPSPGSGGGGSPA